jgi:hypothetical protein
MRLLNRFCGWLLAAAWLGVAAISAFCVYLGLTFSFVPRTLTKAFYEDWRLVTFWSLVGMAFLAGSWAVALRRDWGKPFSTALCVATIFFLATQLFTDGLFWFGLGAAGTVGTVGVLALILCWLNSRGGQMYFQRMGHPA